jgi:hypothetical protein
VGGSGRQADEETKNGHREAARWTNESAGGRRIDQPADRDGETGRNEETNSGQMAMYARYGSEFGQREGRRD